MSLNTKLNKETVMTNAITQIEKNAINLAVEEMRRRQDAVDLLLALALEDETGDVGDGSQGYKHLRDLFVSRLPSDPDLELHKKIAAIFWRLHREFAPVDEPLKLPLSTIRRICEHQFEDVAAMLGSVVAEQQDGETPLSQHWSLRINFVGPDGISRLEEIAVPLADWAADRARAGYDGTTKPLERAKRDAEEDGQDA
ncbi:MAG: hypothetical protein ACK4HW_08455 [Roseinatronobacter sp.]